MDILATDSLYYWHTFHNLRRDIEKSNNLLQENNDQTTKLLWIENYINQGRLDAADSLNVILTNSNFSSLDKAQNFFNKANKTIWSFDIEELQTALSFLDSASIFADSDHILFYKIVLNKAFVLVNIGTPEALVKAERLLHTLYPEPVPKFIQIIAWFQSGRIAFSQGNQSTFLQSSLQCNRLNNEINFWAQDHPLTINIKNSIGMSYKEIGDFKTASTYLEEVVEYYKNNNPAGYLERLLNLASVYQGMGKNALAQSLYEEILEKRKSTRDTLYYQVLNNLSLVKFELGDQRESIEIAKNVLSGKKRILSNQNHSLHISYLNLAKLLKRQGSYNLAINQYRSTFKETPLEDGMKGGLITEIFIGLGTCYKNLNMAKEAEAYFLKAIASSQLDSIDFDHFDPSNIVSFRGQLEALIEIFKLLTQDGQYQDNLEKLTLYINQLVQFSFDNFQSREAKREVFVLAKNYFDLSIGRWAVLAVEGSNETAAKILINQIEYSKSAFLKSKINREQLFESHHIEKKLTDSLEAIEATILSTLKLIENSSKEEEDYKSSRSIYIRLLEAKTNLITSIKSKNPGLNNLWTQNEAFDINIIQEKMIDLGINVIISYYYSDDYLLRYSIFPTRYKITLDSVDINQPLRNYLNAYFRTPLSENLAAYQDESNFLFLSLFDSAVVRQERIMVIPYQDLAYLPFNSLIYRKSPDTKSFRYLNYLSKEVALHQHFSIPAWLASPDPVSMKKNGSYVGFAPDFGNSEYPALLHTDDEVTYMQSLFGGKVHLGREATINELTQEGIHTEVLHLATHAFIDTFEPILNSRILLSSAAGDIENLYAYEIYNADISSRLTLLSACDTGNGLIEAGEGVSSLARAFYYGGCPSIVMSLWSASDFAAKEIVMEMGTQLVNSQPTDIALTRSVNQFLSSTLNDKFTHPYYWSNFVLVGDSNFRFEKATNNLIWIGLMVFALIALVMGWKYFTRR